MSAPIIRVENVSKRYRLGVSRHDTLRDRLSHLLRAPFRSRKAGGNDEFWALNEISFDVKEGEVLGIIGRNGAGKSTLLKILSRITEPTTGRITLRGRVASLLEVGTGFHPELSGRENIYLNGAMLGMSRAEIRRKFDEIVAFSEVERFLDTPVKHYSSGMYVRLAFAVAAHLEPEILIVDEVLAVGDAQFQKKCLGRMDAVSRSGRTILFVSHNLEALRAICHRGLLLQAGRIKEHGTIDDVLAQYHGAAQQMTATYPADPHKPSVTRVEVDAAELTAGNLVARVSYASPRPLRPAIAGMTLCTFEGRPVFGTNMRMHPPAAPIRETTSGVCTVVIPRLPLHSGSYTLTIWFGDNVQDYDVKPDAVSFEYVAPVHYPNRPPLHVIGPADFPCTWTLQPCPTQPE